MKALDNIKVIKWIVLILMFSNLITATALVFHINKLNKMVVLHNSGVSAEMPPRRLHPHHPGRISEELNLDEKQQADFNRVKSEFKTEARAIGNDLKTARDNLFVELHKDEVDTIKVKELTAEIGELHTSLKMLTVEFYLEMKEECTPEQQEKLFHHFNRMSEARPDFGYRRQQWGNGRGINR